MGPNLLDHAYFLRKQSETEPAKAAAFEQLQLEFPGASLPQIENAYDVAGQLIHACCEWADQLRGPKNVGTGTPTFHLRERCPGFSDGTYTNAESWGLYLTK